MITSVSTWFIALWNEMKREGLVEVCICIREFIQLNISLFLLVALTWNVEDLIPPSERFIFNFNSKEELKKWHLYSDSEYGGACLLNFDGFVACLLSCVEHLASDLCKVTLVQCVLGLFVL